MTRIMLISIPVVGAEAEAKVNVKAQGKNSENMAGENLNQPSSKRIPNR